MKPVLDQRNIVTFNHFTDTPAGYEIVSCWYWV